MILILCIYNIHIGGSVTALIISIYSVQVCFLPLKQIWTSLSHYALGPHFFKRNGYLKRCYRNPGSVFVKFQFQKNFFRPDKFHKIFLNYCRFILLSWIMQCTNQCNTSLWNKHLHVKYLYTIEYSSI